METVQPSVPETTAYPGDGSAFSPTPDKAGPLLAGAAAFPNHTWAERIEELLRLRNLKDDWDGEGSEAPHPALVEGAVALARKLEARGELPAHRVHASVNGTVYFEWYTTLGYQEIEVTSPCDAEYRRVQKGTGRTVVVNLSCNP